MSFIMSACVVTIIAVCVSLICRKISGNLGVIGWLALIGFYVAGIGFALTLSDIETTLGKELIIVGFSACCILISLKASIKIFQ